MIRQLFDSGKQTLSFEVFPPKKEEEFENAQNILTQLAELSPDFISVTYGAGGSRSKRTVELASFIQNRLHIPAVSHMTCVGSSYEDILAVADAMKKERLSHVLALRGDRPAWMDAVSYTHLMQKDGAQYRAAGVSCSLSASSISMDIAPAYPSASPVSSYRRSTRLYKG